MVAQGKSNTHYKIHISTNSNISHPIQNLDNIRSKKIIQQNTLSVNHPYIQHSTKNIIPRILKNHVSRVIKKKEKGKQ